MSIETRLHRAAWCALAALLALARCTGDSAGASIAIAPEYRTPTPTVGPSRVLAEWPVFVEPDLPAPAAVSAAEGGGVRPLAPGGCAAHPDRWAWQAYAAAYDWPLDEVARVVQAESGGDLCATNRASGAACWFQLHPGRPEYYDPAVCTAGAYAKWLDGGRSFGRHWYAFWR